MRILVVAPGPSQSVADVQRGWERALRKQGHDVRTYNLDDRLSFFGAATFDDGENITTLTPEEAVRLAIEPLGAACYKWWPDVVFVVSGFFISDDLWETWKHRPQKVVLLNTESPYEDTIQFERMMKGEPDVMLLNDPINLHVFASEHHNVHYMPHAYDPEIHCPGPSVVEWECDFSFVGTGYPSRIDFFARCDFRDIEVLLAGMWKAVGGTCLERYVMHPLEDCFDNADAVDLYRSSQVSANLYRARTGGVEALDARLTQGYAVGPREIELAACRTFFLREPRGEGDELFKHAPIIRTPEEFDETLRWYLAHEDARDRVIERNFDAIQDRTFDAHAARLMQLLPD